MSKTLIIGTIAVMVGIFALGGFLLWQMQSDVPDVNQGGSPPPPPPAPMSTPPAQQTLPPIPSPQVQVLDTSTWQTYRNAKYGFEVRYPEEFEVNVAGPSKASLNRLDFVTIDICEDWSWYGDYGYVLSYLDESYSRNDMVIDGHEVLVHLYNSSSAGYTYAYEIKKDNCTSLIFTFASSGVSQPTAEQKDLFDQILSTFRFVEEDEVASWSDCVDDPESAPVITSVSPDSGPVGTELEIRGCNFSGFEGDLNAWIGNDQGVSGILYGQEGSTSKFIKVILRSSLCQGDNSYSGLPCREWLTLTPGIYEIRVSAWQKTSNGVNFTITQ